MHARRPRFDAFRSCAVAVLIALAASTSIAAQDTDDAAAAEDLPRVLVIPFENATGQAQNDAVANATTDTIRLTVNLLDAYRLVEMPDLTEEQQQLGLTELAATLAEQLATESVLYGEVTRDDAGTFLFTLSVWDRRQQAVRTTTETESTSLFGVFDAADELVAEAVSAFAGVRIGFGSINFTAPAEDRYRVYLDGSVVGDNVRSIDRVLIGERTVRITQVIGDREREIYTETFTIEEGDRETVLVQIPEATPEEIARARDLVEGIEERMDLGAGLGPVAGDLRELERLLEIAPGALPDPRGTLSHLQERWTMVGMIPEIAATDFGAIAAASGEQSRETARGFVEPIRDLLERLEDEPNTPENRRLRDDALRNAAILYDVIVLRRAAVDRDEVDIIRNLNLMIANVNGRIARVHDYDRPYADATVESLRFYRRYERAIRRRRPFWHWVAGTLGAAGIAGGTYLQLIEIPGLRDAVAAAQADYDAATSVAAATAARSDMEARNTQLVLMQGASGIAYATGLLLPIALVSRVRSLSRPGRLWRRFEESPDRLAIQAVALDVRDRPWEEGPPGVLILGENEQATLLDSGETVELPVYVPFPEGLDRLTVQHDSSALSGRPQFEVPRQDGLSLLYLGEPLPDN